MVLLFPAVTMPVFLDLFGTAEKHFLCSKVLTFCKALRRKGYSIFNTYFVHYTVFSSGEM